MLCLFVVVVAAVVVAVTEGQGFISYDGTRVFHDDFIDQPSPPAFQPMFIGARASQRVLPPRQPAVFMAPNFVQQVGVPQQVTPQAILPSLCPHSSSLAHHSYERSFYHFSWCHHLGHVFTHQQAADYCRNLNNFGQPMHFEVLRIDDFSELRFIVSLIHSHGISSVWTRDTSHTAAYSIRQYINRSGSSHPGEDCLSVEGAHRDWQNESRCSDHKFVICEARHWN